jgi:hypothetical protein
VSKLGGKRPSPLLVPRGRLQGVFAGVFWLPTGRTTIDSIRRGWVCREEMNGEGGDSMHDVERGGLGGRERGRESCECVGGMGGSPGKMPRDD